MLIILIQNFWCYINKLCRWCNLYCIFLVFKQYILQALRKAFNAIFCCNNFSPDEENEENNNTKKRNPLNGSIRVIQLKPRSLDNQSDFIQTKDKGTMTSNQDFSRLSPESFNLTNSFALSSDRSNFEKT